MLLHVLIKLVKYQIDKPSYNMPAGIQILSLNHKLPSQIYYNK